jgi:hypothetical protein
MRSLLRESRPLCLSGSEARSGTVWGLARHSLGWVTCRDNIVIGAEATGGAAEVPRPAAVMFSHAGGSAMVRGEWWRGVISVLYVHGVRLYYLFFNLAVFDESLDLTLRMAWHVFLFLPVRVLE